MVAFSSVLTPTLATAEHEPACVAPIW